jgi:hypothetical protein
MGTTGGLSTSVWPTSTGSKLPVAPTKTRLTEHVSGYRFAMSGHSPFGDHPRRAIAQAEAGGSERRKGETH